MACTCTARYLEYLLNVVGLQLPPALGLHLPGAAVAMGGAPASMCVYIVVCLRRAARSTPWCCARPLEHAGRGGVPRHVLRLLAVVTLVACMGMRGLEDGMTFVPCRVGQGAAALVAPCCCSTTTAVGKPFASGICIRLPWELAATDAQQKQMPPQVLGGTAGQWY